MKTFFYCGYRARQSLAILLLATGLLTACKEVQKELAHEHQHQASSKPAKDKPTAISRPGPHKGKVVHQLKVNWELVGGPQTRLYLLDNGLKQLPLKPIEAEVVIEKPGGQQITKFKHLKDHLEAKLAYDPAKDKAMVMMTVKGKTEMIDFSQ